MSVKRGLVFLFLAVTIFSLASAQEYKMEISVAKEKFEAGKNITLKVSIFNSENKPVDDLVSVILEDAEKRINVEKMIPSNEFADIDLGDGASYGQGKITARYRESEATRFFTIEIRESAVFTLNGNNLIITNTGNTRYTKTVHITIGETTGIKNPKLDVGEKVSYKLIAPEGVYSIKITDGKTELTKGDVQLTGTGRVIGALDETLSQRSSITGGISPDEESDEILLSYFKNSSFVYVFILVVFGATILLAVERNYRKRVGR